MATPRRTAYDKEGNFVGRAMPGSLNRDLSEAAGQKPKSKTRLAKEGWQHTEGGNISRAERKDFRKLVRKNKVQER